MEPRFRLRLYLLTGLIIAGLLALLTRLLEFQITMRDDFLRKVPGNQIVTVREPGVRGEITDRNGVPLASNLRRYEVSFNLDEIYNAYRQQHANAPKQDKLVREGGMPRKGQEVDIVKIVKETVIDRLDQFGLAKSFSGKALKAHYLTHKGLVPFTYSVDLTYDEFAKLAEHNLDLPGVNIDTRPQRVYPYGTLASHVLGYLKQWDKGDIPPDAARTYDHYIGEEKGISGIEATEDSVLRGAEGIKTMIKDEKGRITGMLDYTRPGDGARVELTLDARVQYLTENVLRRAGRAAAVVMDVNTGEVIAMASVPDYDPNAFIPSIKSAKWQAYNANTSKPFLNRCIAGFTPGSTFKIPTAIAGATKGMATRTYNCNGFVPYGNHKIGCWIWNKNGGSHGAVNLAKAIQQSCNPYFNQMANAVGASAMVNAFEMLNFGKATGIELPEEDPGILPGSRSWLRRKKETLTPVNQAFLSIGQGDSSATPLQLCAMVSCIANGGKYYQPRIVKRAVRPDGKVEIEDKPKLQVDLLKEGVKASDIALIHKGMWMAVNEAGGTAGRAKLTTIQVAAKTGTAQTTDNGKKSNNSWTIAFAPFEQPKYAVCVMVQAGKGGGKVCGPLVNLILSGLFARDEGLKLPLQKQTEFGGHTNSIEEIALPTDVLAAIDATEATGETGEEAGDAIITENQDGTTPRATPALTPTITPEVDDEGVVIPRAVPVKPPNNR